MRARHVLTALAVSSILLVAGCGSDEEQTVAPKAAGKRSAADAQATDPVGATPFTVAANALKLGDALGPDGAAVGNGPPFALNQTVYVSFPVKGKPLGAPVTVYWTYQDGRTDFEERTKLAPTGENASYSFDQARGMKAGTYNVEVQVNNRPVGISDFVVR